MTDTIYFNESPQKLIVGAARAFSFDWSSLGYSTVSSPSTTLYLPDGTDYSSTGLSGSDSVSGTTQTTKTVTAQTDDDYYVLFVTATVDGLARARLLQINVVEKYQRQDG